ncbi:MAG: 2-C-methyl-D-erythritol 2,4-cyclodiphosphate synthase [Pirellulaceae bacterium]|nr:2-C-methyl-D-erythritol 2,4-cyclodiphosphate synthase [Planctomycetales bacterium]
MTWPYRVGFGDDTHRLQPGGPLRLGGLDVPFEYSLAGHSDADVLLHAITDALLGAAGLGDIGELFPDTAEENRGRDSAEMLALVREKVIKAGFAIVNVDCIVQAQRPKLSPYKELIRQRVAEFLAIEPGCVGLKAKTGELVGPVGRGEAIVAQCVALLAQHPADRPTPDTTEYLEP